MRGEEDFYDLLIVSPIQIVRRDGACYTFDLWARDLVEQSKCVRKLGIVAPVSDAPAEGLVELPDGVDVFSDGASSNSQTVAEIVDRYAVVQVHSAASRCQKRTYARFARAAQAHRKLLILSISSNRAKTWTINAERKGILSRLRARLAADNLRRNQRHLSRLADGILLTGHGLLDLIDEGHEVHIGIASWIESRDIIHPKAAELRGTHLATADSIRLCIACRLERMKGTAVGVNAFSLLGRTEEDPAYDLTIVGVGPEIESLQKQVSRLGLEKCVAFAGKLGYPEPFLSTVAEHDLLLMTNLNDEQPRVLFDALSQGVVTLVPDSRPYRDLPLNEAQYYARGEAQSLADAIRRVIALVRGGHPLTARCREVASMFTIQKMHEERAGWIAGLLERSRIHK